jgi:ATP-binding cassette subfamily G (WHITE) protein 2 (SNQ2)
MFRPSTVALTRFLIDITPIAFQHVLCVLPYYFLSRLQLDAGKLFFFYFTLLLSTINFGNLLRMFAYYMETLDDCKSAPTQFSKIRSS